MTLSPRHPGEPYGFTDALLPIEAMRVGRQLQQTVTTQGEASHLASPIAIEAPQQSRWRDASLTCGRRAGWNVCRRYATRSRKSVSGVLWNTHVLQIGLQTPASGCFANGCAPCSVLAYRCPTPEHIIDASHADACASCSERFLVVRFSESQKF